MKTQDVYDEETGEVIKVLEGVEMLVWDGKEASAIPQFVTGRNLTNKQYPITDMNGGCWKHAKPLPKPREVAPEGHFIVSWEDRLKYPAPQLRSERFKYRINSEDKWRNSVGKPAGWRNKDVIYALPIGFEFEPKPTVYTPSQAMRILEKHAGGKVVVTQVISREL